MGSCSGSGTARSLPPHEPLAVKKISTTLESGSPCLAMHGRAQEAGAYKPKAYGPSRSRGRSDTWRLASSRVFPCLLSWSELPHVLDCVHDGQEAWVCLRPFYQSDMDERVGPRFANPEAQCEGCQKLAMGGEQHWLHTTHVAMLQL